MAKQKLTTVKMWAVVEEGTNYVARTCTTRRVATIRLAELKRLWAMKGYIIPVTITGPFRAAKKKGKP